MQNRRIQLEDSKMNNTTLQILYQRLCLNFINTIIQSYGLRIVKEEDLHWKHEFVPPHVKITLAVGRLHCVEQLPQTHTHKHTKQQQQQQSLN